MEKTKVDAPHSTTRPPSIWAFILIAVGVIWLLGQAGILTASNFAVLGKLWPLILVAFGVDLLFGRQRGLSMLIGLFTVGLLIVLMFIGPSIGLASNAELVTETFSEPIGDATSAEIYLNGSVGELTVSALSDSNDLITVDTAHYGTVSFDVSGESRKAATLGYDWSSTINFNFFGWFGSTQNQEAFTRVSLTPNIPLDLQFSGSVGGSNLDLSELTIAELNLSGSVGEVNVTLPASGDRYQASINGGVGRTEINASSASPFDMRVSGGVGELEIDLPDDAPVRVEFNGGLGDLSAPGWLERTSGDDDHGVWESDSYAEADESARYDLDINGGVGGVNLR